MPHENQADIVGQSSSNSRAILTPERIDDILRDFRDWLLNLPADAGNSAWDLSKAPCIAEAVDLHTLLEHFTALRHEVNLQTKASRSQQEQNRALLDVISRTVDALNERHVDREQALQETKAAAQRPLLKVLVDLYDALSLGQREIRRSEQTLLEELEALHQRSELPAPTLPPPTPTPPEPVPIAQQPWWRRLLGGQKGTSPRPEQEEFAAALEVHYQEMTAFFEIARDFNAALQRRRQELADAVAKELQMVRSLLTGYSMSVQRIERALQAQGLVPIEVLGKPFDPETMEALEVVTEPGRQQTEVIEVVRRGYTWDGKIFRFAQVRVAKPE